jgi:Zn-finger nucleic acid-binding protein
MPLLLCPNDNSSMQTVDRAGVQFDMCPTCRGVWLDRGELEKLMAAGVQDAPPPPQGANPGYAAPPPQPPPQQPWNTGYGRGERGEYGERGERGEYGERGEHGYGGYRKKRSIFDIFD